MISVVATLAALLVLAGGQAYGAGPALTVPQSELAGALSCPSQFDPSHKPVLLVHGTGTNAAESWSWGYAKVLPAYGFDVCTVDLPGRAWGDIQVSSEYVVYAIRTIAAQSGRTVDIIGHSQGTIQPRWAIKWWPDLAGLVDDYVSLAGPHHGTVTTDWCSTSSGCLQAAWQLRQGSMLLGALNSGDETPGALSYTSIYTSDDLYVLPNATSRLEGGTNILLQDVCPVRYPGHVGLLADATTFALVIDALSHDGPADPQRVLASGQGRCNEALMPGVNPVEMMSAFAVLGARFLSYPPGSYTRAEPPLAAYAAETPGPGGPGPPPTGPPPSGGPGPPAAGVPGVVAPGPATSPASRSQPPGVIAPRRLSISYGRRAQTFRGVVSSISRPCAQRVRVTLFEQHRGKNRRVGSDRTTPSGRWRERVRGARGHYYAKVSGSDLQAVTCLAARSALVDVP
jgi:triacylglycerol esterase/lipase EstA (alpha/beta hydrolase family)